VRLRRDLALARRLGASPLLGGQRPTADGHATGGTNIGTWTVDPVGAGDVGSTGYARPAGITEVEM
jgi:hypothetical protein